MELELKKYPYKFLFETISSNLDWNLIIGWCQNHFGHVNNNNISAVDGRLKCIGDRWAAIPVPWYQKFDIFYFKNQDDYTKFVLKWG